MRRLTAAATGLALVAILGTLLTACGSGQGSPPPRSLPPAMPQKCTKDGPVVFVVSGRQDSPAPAFTGVMSNAAQTAINQGSPIGLVDLDGKPRLTVAGRFSDPGVNAAARQNDEQSYLAELSSDVQAVRARYPHADMLDALNEAGRAAHAGCPHGGTIYVEDSGLQETGPMNFRQPGLLAATPADVVAFLKGENELPELAGLSVVFAGLGDTAPPQHPLSIAQQDNLIAIWRAVTLAGGATSVVIDPAPRAGIGAPRHVPSVLLVPVPAEPPWNSRDHNFVFPDSGPVGFRPNTTVFRNPAAALAALRPLGQYLAANPSARIELTGTTAHWGTLQSCQALARRRASTVQRVLLHFGAKPDQISTRGLGWRFPGYENDQGPHHTLLPGPAEHNRSVIVTQLPSS
jgi:outer membrane protein OmpA-like peptidoglycan-associated protein